MSHMQAHYAQGFEIPAFICFICDQCNKRKQYKTYGANSITNDEMAQILNKFYVTGEELCLDCKAKKK